jgi:hypothetical protein
MVNIDSKPQPTKMSSFKSISVFQDTTGINKVIDTINTMISYFNSEVSYIKDSMATKDYVSSETTKYTDSLNEQLNALSAKVDRIMGDGGDFKNAEPSEGGRRSKRRTMKKRK